MSYPRRRFGALSLEVPPGLFEDDEAGPGYQAALTAIAPATLRIREVDPAGMADLAALLASLQQGMPRRVSAAGETHLWPGLAVDVPGDPRRVHYLFESAGRAYHGIASAPDGIWPDYGPFLEAAMLSLDAGAPPAPGLPLFAGEALPEIFPKPAPHDRVAEIKGRLEAAEAEAAGLILEGRLAEAEALIRSIDPDIYGAIAILGAYEAALVESPSREDVFERAIHWAHRTFPDPHTPFEAEAYQSGIAQSEARLKSLFRRP